MRWPRALATDSLALRLLASHLAVLVPVGLIGALGPLAVLRWNFADLTDRTLTEEVDTLRSGLRRDASGLPVAFDLPAESRWLFGALPNDLTYRLVDAKGRVRLTPVPGASPSRPPGSAMTPRVPDSSCTVAKSISRPAAFR